MIHCRSCLEAEVLLGEEQEDHFEAVKVQLGEAQGVVVQGEVPQGEAIEVEVPFGEVEGGISA